MWTRRASSHVNDANEKRKVILFETDNGIFEANYLKKVSSQMAVEFLLIK
jgi:hypothetical protein